MWYSFGRESVKYLANTWRNRSFLPEEKEIGPHEEKWEIFQEKERIPTTRILNAISTPTTTKSHRKTCMLI
jgi:hypothetical protein